ncbi:MAG: O-antigen ligase family protein [Candidatus Portnoybacteria bacterium]|nr:O-antigen ligase family protein [Candidatus Portnoybacteria bacterium]
MIILEKILFYLLIFCLPFQTRKILYQWGDGFNEWTSAYLYLTDLLILLIFLVWAWRKRKERFFKRGLAIGRFQEIMKSPSFWLAAFLIVSLISLVQARNIQLGFYAWFKLLEFAGLFFYLKYNFRQLFNFERVAQVFLASGLFQSFIAFGQYTSQKSLGLRYLFESPLGPETAGVAKIVVEGTKMIRPYGSLPHPNLLAVFLLLSIFCFCFLWLNKKHSFIKNCFLLIVFCLLIFTLGLTFSRLIIFTFLLASLIYFVFTFWRVIQTSDKELFKRIISIFLLFIVFCSLFTALAWPEISSRWPISLTEQSVGLRTFYNQTAFSMIKEHPWLGIGLGNFVWEIREMFHLLSAWLHQPVHNVYLLIVNEVGLISLVVFLLFLWKLLKKINQKEQFLLLLVFSFLFIALFDHFFWTLQQGQLMFWLILGIIGANCPHSLTDRAYPSGG